MSSTPKYYVVWRGREPGIYRTWEACQQQVAGFPCALFKSFKSEDEAKAAFANAPEPNGTSGTTHAASQGADNAEKPADTRSYKPAAGPKGCPPPPPDWRHDPVHGTNNIGEFLAIVHALALLKQRGRTMTIYTDSRNALLWVKARKCRTKLERTPRTEQLFQLIERAEQWLRTHDYSDIPIIKWETKRWGEVPADFGRK